MLKFDESERPSFVELAKLVLTSEDNSLQSPKNGDRVFNELDLKRNSVGPSLPAKHGESAEIVGSPNGSNHLRSDTNSFPRDMESSSNFMTQADLFKNYVEANNLYISFDSEMYWFEFGGQRIGRLELRSNTDQDEASKWKLLGKYKYEFPCHYTLVHTNDGNGFFMLGGKGNN